MQGSRIGLWRARKDGQMLPSSQLDRNRDLDMPPPLGPTPSLQSQRILGGSKVRSRIIGNSPALRAALDRAAQAARSSADILIEAESGTGKELLARLIHEESCRAAMPFVALNCSAVPESLLESELFGHVRGAFTGALANHAGKFQQAHRGTLLLDEVSEMPMLLQPKLLRVLQEREFYRLGDNQSVVIDIRVIATTNRTLQNLVLEGRFREDLYYRLNVIPLTLPPLRQRGKDVLELAQYFAAQFSAPSLPPALTAEFKAALQDHTWPGNVRELANTMRRAVALCDNGEIAADVLQVSGPSLHLAAGAAYLRPGLSFRELEKSLLEITLAATAGNRTRAAELLGVSLRTIRNKIREYGLPPRRLA